MMLTIDGDELVALIAVPQGAAHDAQFYALPGPGVALRRLPAPLPDARNTGRTRRAACARPDSDASRRALTRSCP